MIQLHLISYFVLTVGGEVMREMYMASNAINNPILYMEIKAFVE